MTEKNVPVTWTEAAQEAVMRVDNQHHFHGDTCLCGFRSPVSRERTEHLTRITRDALAPHVEARVRQVEAERDAALERLTKAEAALVEVAVLGGPMYTLLNEMGKDD